MNILSEKVTDVLNWVVVIASAVLSFIREILVQDLP